MVQVEDLKKMGEPEEPCKAEKPTLLTKYQIPVQHLDFEYVEKCENGRELEKILHILKSGEEGYFPDLITTTEKQLAQIKPNSKFLRKACPVLSKTEVNQDEWNDLSQDLAGWVDDVNKKDQELEHRKVKSDVHLAECEVRKTKVGCINQVKANPKRIASTDYESWDKYDPDTEILKMDLEDEKLKKGALKGQTGQKAKTVRFNSFATEAEALFEANREKERGNECFKAGEYQTAVLHYSNSLECKQVAAVYTNRALVYYKVKKYKKAIDDCQAALRLEPDNFKAHLRLAQNYNALKQYAEAMKSVENAIEIDPNNTVAQHLASQIRQAMGKTDLNKRFMIEDVKPGEKSNVKVALKHITNKHVNGNQSKQQKIVIREEIESFESRNVDSVGVLHTKPLKSILKTNKSTEAAEKKSETFGYTNSTKSRAILSSLKWENNENVAKNKKYEVIAIPGTSTMPPPYYKVVCSNDPEIIRREKQKILCRPMLLHITTIDVSSDDEYSRDCNYNEAIENIYPQTCKENKKPQRSASIQIRDDFEDFQLDNFKFNDEEKLKESYKQTWDNICRQRNSQRNTEVAESNFKGAGGEPRYDEQLFVVPTAEELQSPFTFIEAWNSVRKDSSYTQHAEILKKMDFNRICDVIGYKLDDVMLSMIINCLHKHFMVPGELDRLHSILTNIIRIPRFKMMSMFLEESDWRCVGQLIEFLDQHGQSLPNNIKAMYCNK